MAPNFKMGDTNAKAFDKIGFQNGRLRLGKTTIGADLRVKSTLAVTGNTTIGGTLAVSGGGTGIGHSLRDTTRYYLEEYFTQRPALNAVNIIDLNADDAAALAAYTAANKNFEVLGTNMTTALCTFGSATTGIVLTTAATDGDQAIVLPHLDNNQTAWSSTTWGTENQVEWECMIRTSGTITNQKIWAGLKLTMDQLPESDINQAYFYYATDATNGQDLADFTKLYFINSVGGTDYLTNTGITVAADTNYHLKIKFDSDRKVSIFVNGVQYGVSTTAQGTALAGAAQATGTVVSDATQKSAAMTDDISFIPYIGIETGTTSLAALNVGYVSMSRLMFE